MYKQPERLITAQYLLEQRRAVIHVGSVTYLWKCAIDKMPGRTNLLKHLFRKKNSIFVRIINTICIIYITYLDACTAAA